MFSILRPFLNLSSPKVVSASPSAAGQSTRTLNNLQAAFHGESNANARYLGFAKRADEEGYGEVASLFRAAAKAEEIHAHNHAAVMRQLGGEPILKIEPLPVKSTRENLIAAVEGEVYERDVMYPDFIAEAKQQHLPAAVQTFTLALKVEAVHATLYQDALENLAKRRGASHIYFVCPDCGNTLEQLSIVKCVICGHLKSGFIAVN
ncbi:MAG TPA: ferritin family protein [Candidatus Angelobacter sp.]|jgi:rubrerythrin|nr:ferritin family protein [Candidatus Angelobacter sp.]